MTKAKENLEQRQRILAGAKRLVVKVGSRLLTGMADTPEQGRIQQLISEIANARGQGCEIVLVSSGAIAAGMMVTETEKRPGDLAQLQALAAIGQSRLMSLYESACQEHQFHCAQILLSWDDVKDRKRHLNVRNCIYALLSRGILPVINENDTVSVDEIRFGDNDRLAALVGTMIRAELTILLTTVDGLLEGHTPGGRGRAERDPPKRISVITKITPEIRAMAGGTDDKQFSVGGMSSKLEAAEMVMEAGDSLWIANGSDFGVLRRILAGEDVGSVFVPQSSQLSGAKRWLAFFADPAGDLEVDDGAAAALRTAGKSLLPSGIVGVKGNFEPGDTVRILDAGGQAVAVGISNYSAADLDRIKGLRTDRFLAILGTHEYDEAVHRNNLVLV